MDDILLQLTGQGPMGVALAGSVFANYKMYRVICKLYADNRKDREDWLRLIKGMLEDMSEKLVQIGTKLEV
jgi:hypothetical protein